jgi:hypothetical protein
MENSTEIQNRKNQFLKHVDALFADIKQWLKSEGLNITVESITIDEEDFASYDCPKLIVKNRQSREIAQIVPIGTAILGANGRVDIKGLYDNAIIVALDKGGPALTTTVRDDNGKILEQRTKSFYKGIAEDGWYWIENKRDKGYKLDAPLFFELLAETSGYESN